MMWRLLADENFNSDIVRGLLLRHPELDLVRVQDVGLAGVDDPGVLAWAAEANRIVASHDVATMATFAWNRIVNSEPLPGLFLIADQLPVGEAIRELALIVQCTEASEWRDRVVFVPL